MNKTERIHWHKDILEDIKVLPDDTQTTIRANIYSSKCMCSTALLFFLTYILNELGVFALNREIMATTLWFGIGFLVIAFCTVWLLGLEKEATSFILLRMMILVFTVANVLLSYHATLFFVFPLICAATYESKSITRHVYFWVSEGVLVSTVLSFYLGICDANMLLLTGDFTKDVTAALTSGNFELNQDIGKILLYFAFPRMLILYSLNPVVDQIVSEAKRRSIRKEEQRHLTEVALSESASKGRFLANMSHEIRTPINVVLGMDTMILRECKDPQILEYAADIQNAGNILLSLINNVLDISKIESGKMEIVPVEYDFSSLINDVMNMVKHKAEEKALAVHYELDETLPNLLYGDNIRIRQILVNLMINAVKYTETGSVTLQVSGDIVKDEIQLRFGIKDTGIGIKQEEMEKLFEEFVRIEEQRNRSEEGTGLGMAITVQLLKLMGSKLQVESTYGEGSYFYFDLIQGIADPNPIGDLAGRIRENRYEEAYYVSFVAPDARILVVDDNAANRMVAKNLLKETQIRVEDASTGYEAIERIKQEPYDIIFMDHMMPDMDGVQTLAKIKELPDYPNQNTPIIVLTANAVSGAREQYLEVGFVDYLTKPIVPSKFEQMIVKYLPPEKVRKVSPSEMPARKIANDVKGKAASRDTELEKLPIIEGFDWDYAMLHFPDVNMLLEIAKSFYDTMKTDAKYLEEVFGEMQNVSAEEIPGLLEKYRVKVHAMKSTASMIGCFVLAGMAASLEYAARDMKMDEICSLTPHYVMRIDEYKKKMSVLFDSGKENEYGEDKPKALEQIPFVVDYLDRVAEAMQYFDVHGADETLEFLKEYQYPADMEEMLEQLTALVAALEADQAIALCSQLKEKIMK